MPTVQDAIQALAGFTRLAAMTVYMESLPEPVKRDSRVEKAFKVALDRIKGLRRAA